jgi:8-oxo-dGTP pyrophosphatase MutT (NUDIX family)
MRSLIKRLLREGLNHEIIYHGGDEILKELKPEFIKGGFRANHGWGIYFTSSIYKARDYGPNITYLDISRLKVFDTDNKVDDNLISMIKTLASNIDGNISLYYDLFASKLKTQIGKDIDTARKNINDEFNWDINEMWSKMFVKLGYDVFKNGYEYVIINLEKAQNFLIYKKRKAAGVLIKCETTNRVLLLKRTDEIPSWNLISGNIEKNESPYETLKREIMEEISINPSLIKFKDIGVETDIENLDFYYFEGLTYEEFIPKLNNEHSDFGWFSVDNLPTPLYNGLIKKIKAIL